MKIDQVEINWQELEFVMIFGCGNIELNSSCIRYHGSGRFFTVFYVCRLLDHTYLFRLFVSTASKNFIMQFLPFLMTSSLF